MVNKLNGWCGKLFAVLFTSIVAPVLVNLVVRNTPEAVSSPAHNEQTVSGQVQTSSPAYSAVSSFVLSSTAQPMQIARVIVSGTGLTSEAALQDAVHTALRQALASLVDAEIWSRNNSILCADVLHDLDGILLGWKELGTRKERGPRGLFYHKEAAVEVNLTALADRLRVRHIACWSDPSPATTAMVLASSANPIAIQLAAGKHVAQ
ncbi:MAG TPA: hypothetical protein VMF69_11525 [Gemmataceae bacterium]|nr:hypothetical protein [Gemmataceae bacterium]